MIICDKLMEAEISGPGNPNGPKYKMLDIHSLYTCSGCKDKFPFRPRICSHCSAQKKRDIILCSKCDIRHWKKHGLSHAPYRWGYATDGCCRC